mmetsp:Transcript_37356/g.92382  ORF Transcript_37356/g.92382 Transcript_37356/m.92382 type:complete len:256 (-) Transcript_37356:1736-2503(-)
MVAVVVSLRKPRSWLTITTVFSQRCRNSSSHVSACTSRWFVGSSSSSRSGVMNSACAREMRMRHPPENECVLLCMLKRSGPLLPSLRGTVKPRPCRILLARASAVASPFSLRRSYTLVISSLMSKLSSSSSPAALRSASTASLPRMPLPLSASSSILHAASAEASAASRSSSTLSPPFSSAAAMRSMAVSSSMRFLRSCCSSTSAATTLSSAVRSSPTTSCSTNRMSMKSGTGSLRRASSFMMVVLPMPLGPTRP